MVRALTAALAAAALVLVAGCGDGEDDVATTSADEPSATTSTTPSDPTPPPLPPCARIWPRLQVLPDGYAGCREGGERMVKSVRCETGQRLFTYAGRYFAVPGGPIFTARGALADDRQFQKMERACRA